MDYLTVEDDERYEKSMQFHTGTGEIQSSGQRAAMYHSHDPSDDDQKRLIRWFQKVDEERKKFLADENAPLVLAGVDYYFPLYRRASEYPNIMSKGVAGNPDQLMPEEIHSQAWPIVEPIFTQAKEDAIARYHQLAAQGNTSNGVKQIVQAAYEGRVETLFVSSNIEIWGRFATEKPGIEIHEYRQPGDEDLLDFAAVHTLAKGGIVYVMNQDRMPNIEPIAAILRY